LENVDMLYGHLEYFTDIGDILLPFGTFCVHLVRFPPVLVSCTKKNLATLVPTLSLPVCEIGKGISANSTLFNKLLGYKNVALKKLTFGITFFSLTLSFPRNQCCCRVLSAVHTYEFGLVLNRQVFCNPSVENYLRC
jgi:hypothetical protein